jgi:hypothetical protein
VPALLFALSDCAWNRRATLGHRKPDRVKIKSTFARSPVSILCQVLPSLRRTINNHQTQGETAMAKGEQRSNREAKKPKKEKIKTIAAAPSQKSVGSLQPGVGATKRK